MDFMTKDMISYKRQILQRIKDPPLPPGKVLKDDEVQKWLAKNIFNAKRATELGATYLNKQLDRICITIERAITDPHEEEVSAELYQLRSSLPTLAAEEREREMTQLPKKTLVRYHPPTDFDTKEQYISMLEKPLVIGSGSDTGNRTWEASLRLMHFLYSNPELIKGRRVLEVGAGSGLLSIFCAAVLGAAAVTATDASPQILEALDVNINLNEEYWSSGQRRPTTRLLNFSEDLVTSLKDEKDLTSFPDIILGADLIYDIDLARTLGRSLQAITIDRDIEPIDIVTVATERNTATFGIFETEFRSGKYIPFTVPEFHHQKGLYHTLATQTRIYGVLHDSK